MPALAQIDLGTLTPVQRAVQALAALETLRAENETLTEEKACLPEELVCGDEQGLPLVARRDEFEEDVSLVLLDIGDIVEDQEMVAVEPGQQCFQGQFAAYDLHALHQIGGSGEEHAVSVLDQGEADARWLLPTPGDPVPYCP